MWVFYCNRGQVITSCGVRDKDGAIMEYHPANTAYQRVGTEGFRTFIWNGDRLYELFQPGAAAARQTLLCARMKSSWWKKMRGKTCTPASCT